MGWGAGVGAAGGGLRRGPFRLASRRSEGLRAHIGEVADKMAAEAQELRASKRARKGKGAAK